MRRQVCKEIELRYEIQFIEIGSDIDHVHFLVQSVPTYSPKKVVNIVKSITTIKVFKANPEVKKKLWGGNFWTSGYYINTVGQYANLNTISDYVKNQGNAYKMHYQNKQQLNLF